MNEIFSVTSDNFAEVVKIMDFLAPELVVHGRCPNFLSEEMLLDVGASIVAGIYANLSRMNHPHVSGRLVLKRGSTSETENADSELLLIVKGIEGHPCLEDVIFPLVMEMAILKAAEYQPVGMAINQSTWNIADGYEIAKWISILYSNYQAGAPTDYAIFDTPLLWRHFNMHGVDLGSLGTAAKFFGLSPAIHGEVMR